MNFSKIMIKNEMLYSWDTPETIKAYLISESFSLELKLTAFLTGTAGIWQ